MAAGEGIADAGGFFCQGEFLCQHLNSSFSPGQTIDKFHNRKAWIMRVGPVGADDSELAPVGFFSSCEYLSGCSWGRVAPASFQGTQTFVHWKEDGPDGYGGAAIDEQKVACKVLPI